METQSGDKSLFPTSIVIEEAGEIEFLRAKKGGDECTFPTSIAFEAMEWRV
jgi:hypothetical protein